MLSIPIVELRIHAMGEQITSAVALHANEIAERVKKQVDQVIKNFDFESYVRSECEIALRNYMTEGAGGEAVRELASKLGEQALDKILHE